jgi:hypothetical protein
LGEQGERAEEGTVAVKEDKRIGLFFARLAVRYLGLDETPDWLLLFHHAHWSTRRRPTGVRSWKSARREPSAFALQLKFRDSTVDDDLDRLLSYTSFLAFPAVSRHPRSTLIFLAISSLSHLILSRLGRQQAGDGRGGGQVAFQLPPVGTVLGTNEHTREGWNGSGCTRILPHRS